MSLREQFEKLWPTPIQVEWLPHHNEYSAKKLADDDVGNYYNAIWQGFQAGHAAGLEDAAVECERMEPDTNHSGHVFRAHANVYYAAAAIRAMKGEVK